MISLRLIGRWWWLLLAGRISISLEVGTDIDGNVGKHQEEKLAHPKADRALREWRKKVWTEPMAVESLCF